MAAFKVLSRVDAYSDYVTEVEADSAEEAVDLVYDGEIDVVWEPLGVVEFNAVQMAALDEDGNEIGGYSRGKG